MKIPKPRKLKSGNWFIQLRINGESIPITNADEKRCIAEAAAIKAGVKQAEKKPDSITLDEAISQYIELRSNVLSPATIRGYEIIRKNRFPTLMKTKIGNISKKDVQKAVNDEVDTVNNGFGNKDKTVSPKSIGNAYGLVRSVLSEHDIDVSGVKLPQKIKPKKKYLESDEIVRLIDAAQGDSCEIPIVLAAWLGLRRSEIIGLRWESIDFHKKAITVENTVVPDKDNKWVSKKGAKNESSQRTINCPDYILDKLKKYPQHKDGQVFHIHPETVRKHVHRLCALHGLPDCGVHALRHANAAVMTALDITDRCAMARGGWSTEYTFKQIYSYLFDKDAAAADQKINEFFSSKLKNESYATAQLSE